MIRFLFALLLSSAAYADEAPVEAPIESVRRSITTGITVPQPLELGYELIYPEMTSLHFFAEGGFFYLPMSGKLKKISVWNLQVGTRFFPFEDWFYLSGAFGYRSIGLGTDISNLKLDGVSLANSANLSLNAFMLEIAVGGQWMLSEKVSIAVELGAQLPIPGLHWGNTEIVQDQSDGSDLGVDDSDALSRVSNLPVPKLALVRFIWSI